MVVHSTFTFKRNSDLSTTMPLFSGHLSPSVNTVNFFADGRGFPMTTTVGRWPLQRRRYGLTVADHHRIIKFFCLTKYNIPERLENGCRRWNRRRWCEDDADLDRSVGVFRHHLHLHISRENPSPPRQGKSDSAFSFRILISSIYNSLGCSSPSLCSSWLMLLDHDPAIKNTPTLLDQG